MCKELCQKGEGGSLCNCDISPLPSPTNKQQTENELENQTTTHQPNQPNQPTEPNQPNQPTEQKIVDEDRDFI